VLPPEFIIPTAQEITEAVFQLGEDLTAALRFSAAEPVLAPGEPVEYTFEVSDGVSALDPSSVRVHTRVAPELSFEEIVAEGLGGGAYRALLPATDCGGERELYISAQATTGEVAVHPAGAPGELLRG